jgi:hypothetical protein
MAAREVIHFPFCMQLPARWLFPPSSSPEPVAVFPPYLKITERVFYVRSKSTVVTIRVPGRMERLAQLTLDTERNAPNPRAFPPRATILSWSQADDDRILAMRKGAFSLLPTQPERPRTIGDGEPEIQKGGTPT